MDVPFGLWIAVVGGNVAVAAAVILGVLKAGRDTPATARIVAWTLAGWLAAFFVLGGLGVFKATPDRAVPVIAAGVVLPIAAGVWLFRRRSALPGLLQSTPLSWLIGVQLYRVVGAVFLVAWALDLMPWQFAVPAGAGDVLVGVAAAAVARRVARAPERSRGVALAWILFGLADLVVAVTMGFLTSPSPLQQLALNDPNTLISRLPFVLVPTFAVPLSVLLHLAAWQRLRPSVQPAGSVLHGQVALSRLRSLA
jgi:hypothetical protein